MRRDFMPILLALGSMLLGGTVQQAHSASFPGTGSIQVADPTGSLSWNSTNNALTVSCWFKLSIPSDFTLTEDMAILVNSRTKNSTGPYAYAIYLSAATGNIEFSSKGATTEAPQKLIERPYIERWYHVAVVRSGASLQAFVDGRQVLDVTTNVGDSRNTDGVSIGSWGDGKYLRGEVQEVAIYPAAIWQEFITQYMFSDLPIGSFGPYEPLGYFKLAYSANGTDQLRNFALAPPAGTNPATGQGSGAVSFDAVDKSGEQSSFDSQRNQGRNATTPLSGGFSWSHSALSRPTPGVPFDFNIQYDSGNAFNANNVGSFDPFADAALGSGWRHSFETRIIPSNYFSPIGGTDLIGLQLWDGALEVWEDLDYTGTYTTRHKEYRGEIRFPAPSICEWITPDRLIYKFRSPFSGSLLMRGRLLQIRDFNGNALNITWDTVIGRITKVNDNYGGEWIFSYLPTGRLEKITGLGWTVSFAYDAQNRLISKSVTGPPAYAAVASTLWQFAYSDGTGGQPAGLLKQITDPRGKLAKRISYDAYGRKTSETDALGRATQFEYNKPSARQIRTTQVHGTNPALNRVTIQTFDRKLHLLALVDPMGFTTSFEYDAFGNVIKSIDARGSITRMAYDSRSNLLSQTNALGEIMAWRYDALLADDTPLNKPTKDIRPPTAEAPEGWENRYQYDGAGNLLTHSDGPVGGTAFDTLATHVYDSRGLVTSSKDANSNETTFGYDSATGFLTSRTVAFGTPSAATWSFSRSELGWPLAETNPLSETTTLAYNVNGQVVSTTDPIGRVFTKSYDANGNLLAESDGKGATTTFAYDDANEPISRTDRAQKVSNFAYTPFGELEATTGPEAISDGVSQRDTFTRTYDKNGRLTKETDPYGKFVSYEYDENDNQTAVTNKLGQRSRKVFDALNRVIEEIDPLGNTRRTSYDSAGRLLVVTSPNGYSSMHEYDGRGRLTKWTDPEGYSWLYRYDGVGNILDITDAEGGHYLMTYGPRNERLTERNQDGKTWTYTYDELGRLKTQANPPGAGAGPGGGPVVRTLHYDGAGRLSRADFNTGRSNTLGYDNNNNVTSVDRSDPAKPDTSLTLDYDALDRLTTSTDAFSKSVGYGYDALGRVTSKTYPGGKVLTQSYDRLGRLKKLSFAFSATPLECAFSYDDAGRLTGRTYPNGISQAISFDDSSRVTGMDYAGAATPPIALTYAYDRNGNKISSSEKGTLGWQNSSLANYDDVSRFTADGKVIDRTDTAAVGGPRAFSYTYDAAGNMVLATALGESYALTYDEDNRTTSITWDNGLASKQIANRYDALGRRVSRALDGVETRYVLDLAGGMERVLCDTDNTGAIQAWYVHGPDLCFKVSTNGAITCYHADAMANIVRTTDTSGATRNQYAYTPYGRTIPVQGSLSDNDDPYRFVGSQGVMLELPNLYFMRARYYSADAAVFFSTDPVKNIGPGWKPDRFSYASHNPLTFSDPQGLYAVVMPVVKGGINQALRESNDQPKSPWNSNSEFLLNVALDFPGAVEDTSYFFGATTVYSFRNYYSMTDEEREELERQNRERGQKYVSEIFAPLNNMPPIKLPTAPFGDLNSGGASLSSGGRSSGASSGSPRVSKAVDAANVATGLNNSQKEKPKAPSSAEYDRLTKLIHRYQDKMESIDEKIDKIRDRIRDYKKKGRSTDRLRNQLSDLKDDFRDAKEKRDEYRDQRRRL